MWMHVRKKAFKNKLAAAQNNVRANNVVQGVRNGQPEASQNSHVPNDLRAQLEATVAETSRLRAIAMEAERVLVATRIRYVEKLASDQAESDDQIRELTEVIAKLQRELNKTPSIASLVESIRRLDLDDQVHVFMSCFRSTLLSRHEDGSRRTVFDVKENDLLCIGIGAIYSEQERKSLVGNAFKKRGSLFFALPNNSMLDKKAVPPRSYFGSPEIGTQTFAGIRRAAPGDLRINCDFYVNAIADEKKAGRNRRIYFKALRKMKAGSILICACGFDAATTVLPTDPNYPVPEHEFDPSEMRQDQFMGLFKLIRSTQMKYLTNRHKKRICTNTKRKDYYYDKSF